jgi:SnoaL-like domain
VGLAGVRRYLSQEFPVEQNIQCWFGEPIASSDRAAVEWWASWTEHGQELTYAGVTVLRFDEQGKVVEHRCSHCGAWRKVDGSSGSSRVRRSAGAS